MLYFSRPITRAEYVLGKLAVVCIYVSLITTAPALALYLFGVLLSPDLSVLQYTWDLPLRILAASLLMIVPTTTLALAFSSLSTRSYYAGFAWFAFWASGFITYYFLQGTLAERFDDRWALLSLHHTLGRVQSWVFDLGVTFSSVVPFLLVLAGLSVFSVATVFWRVAAARAADRESSHAGPGKRHETLRHRDRRERHHAFLAARRLRPGRPQWLGKEHALEPDHRPASPTLGRLRVFEQRPWNNRDVHRRIGMCPEQDVLYPNVTGFEWVRYLLELHGWRHPGGREAGRRSARLGRPRRRPASPHGRLLTRHAAADQAGPRDGP